MSDDDDNTYVYEAEVEQPDEEVVTSDDEEPRSCRCSKDKRQCPLHHTSSRKSVAWKFFKKQAHYTAVCCLCQSVLSYRTSVSNLKKHLLRKHPVTFATSKGEIVFHSSSNKSADRAPSTRESHGQEGGVRRVADTGGGGGGGGGGGDVFDDMETVKSPSDSRHGAQESASSADKGGTSWDYYTNISLEKAQCRLCDKVIIWQTKEDIIRHLSEEHSITPGDQETSTADPHMPHEVLIEETYLDEDLIREEEDDSKPFRAEPKRRKLMNHGPSQKQEAVCRQDWDTSLDRFGAYVASLMRMLPRKTAAKFQVQIIQRLMEERIKREQ